MDNPIQIIYMISSSVGVCAMIPQIRRLLQRKESNELSLTTWTTWACCQCVSFLYAISIHATAYIIVNIAWISFYFTMVTLIIRYRKRRSLLATLGDWMQRGREERNNRLVFSTESLLAPPRKAEKL